MSLKTPEPIRQLQRKLYAKAKQEPKFRFYLLYDKVYRADLLRHGYALAKATGGAPGVDGKTFAAIEAVHARHARGSRDARAPRRHHLFARDAAWTDGALRVRR